MAGLEVVCLYQIYAYIKYAYNENEKVEGIEKEEVKQVLLSFPPQRTSPPPVRRVYCIEWV